MRKANLWNSIFLLVMFVCLEISSSAQSTYLYFQNNTSLSFNVSGRQFGPHAMSSGEWDETNVVITPWQKESEVLRANRESGVHDGTDFFFDVYLVNGSDTLTLQMQLNGNFIGSDMWHSARGSSFDHLWRNDGSFYQESFTFAGKLMTLKYRAELTGLYDDVFFALHEEDPFPINVSELSMPNVVNILAYNIFMLTPPVSFSDQDERAQHIVDVCDNYDAVLISEAFDNDARINHLIPSMSTEFPYYTEILDTNNALEDGGIMIFSRWPIEREVPYIFVACEQSDCLANKGVMYARINKLGVKYHLFATHTQAFTSAAEVLSRMEQLREIKSFIDGLNIPTSEPVILGGDLNVDLYANHLNEYDSLYTIVNSSEPDLLGYPYTYDPASNYYASGATEYLDYVLPILDNVAPISSTNEPLILRSIDNDMWGLYDLSDHFAVHGRLEYPTNVSLNEIKESILNVYPNPTSGLVSFEKIEAEVKVIDYAGRIILSKNNCMTMDLSALPRGIYFLKAGRRIAKIIKS